MVKKRITKKKVVKRKRRSKKSDPIKRIAISLLLVALIGIGLFFFLHKKTFNPIPNTFESTKYIVKGIDLSHHNPILNWDLMREENISFVYLKATEGTIHQDRNYIYNYDLARKANIKVGTYHFYSFGISGKEQFIHFRNIAKVGTGDLLPAIDVEHSSANPFSKDEKYISLVINELKVLENEFYNYYGIRPVIYTNRDCYKLYIKDNFPDNIIWMCDLQAEPSEKLKNWRIWQFTHTGNLPGFEGNFDLNYYRYSFSEFKELLVP